MKYIYIFVIRTHMVGVTLDVSFCRHNYLKFVLRQVNGLSYVTAPSTSPVYYLVCIEVTPEFYLAIFSLNAKFCKVNKSLSDFYWHHLNNNYFFISYCTQFLKDSYLVHLKPIIKFLIILFYKENVMVTQNLKICHKGSLRLIMNTFSGTIWNSSIKMSRRKLKFTLAA